MTVGELIRQLAAGQLDGALAGLYHDLPAARERALRVCRGWRETFGHGDNDQAMLVSAPGRTELGGNHTDHQHGRVLCASVELDALACTGPNGLDAIRVCSEGYSTVGVELCRMEPLPEEENSSAALIRGVAAGMARYGAAPEGLDLYVTSDVPAGSGLSSSAAFEILLATAMNAHYRLGLDAVTLAKIGQQAENRYFGKPCGLLDQTACAVGGTVAIDFAVPSAPVVEAVPFDFSASGYRLCLVDTGSDHSELSGEYAAIPAEMGAAAACFGKQVLREVDPAQFAAALPRVREQAGDRAALRAMHFFAENDRAQAQAQALRRGDMEGFLRLVDQSGRSSWCLLQNVSVSGSSHQPVAVALAEGQRLLAGRGAIRIHGGGFAGTVLAFVPRDAFREFQAGMDALLGAGACKPLAIRPVGGCVIAGEREEQP